MIESDDGISDDEIISSNNVMADFTLPAAGQKPNFNSTLFPNQQGSSSTPSSQLKKKSRLEQLKEEEDVESEQEEPGSIPFLRRRSKGNFFSIGETKVKY